MRNEMGLKSAGFRYLERVRLYPQTLGFTLPDTNRIGAELQVICGMAICNTCTATKHGIVLIVYSIPTQGYIRSK